jgi:hypothetical protein
LPRGFAPLKLTLAEIDEEYEFNDYTFSSEASTRETLARQPVFSASSNEGISYQGVASRNDPQASDNSTGFLLNLHSVDDIKGVYPASRAYGYIPKAELDPHEEDKLHIQDPQRPLGHGLDGCIIASEILREAKSLDSPNLDGKSRDESKERRQGSIPAIELPVDQRESEVRDHPENSESFDLKITNGVEQAAEEKPARPKHHYEQKNSPNHGIAPTSSNDRAEEVRKPGAGDITAALDMLNLESKITASLPASHISTEPPSAELNTKPPQGANLDFKLMAHAVFGTGFWIEEDGNDLSNLDVEGLCEVYSMNNDLGPLEGRFSDGWKSALRNCQGDSGPSGSGSEKTSGGTPGESGSRGVRQSPSSGGGRHHKRPSEGGDGLEDEDDPSDPSKKAKLDKVSTRRFVCPFYVNDPQYFRTTLEHGRKYMVCAAGIGFLDITRLK